LLLLARGLSALSAHMDAKEATVARGRAAATLLGAMNKTRDPAALAYLAHGLSALAPGMAPKEVAQAASALVQAMTKTTDADALSSLAQGLSALLSRVDSDASRQRPAAVTAAAAQLSDPWSALTAPALPQPALEPPPPLPAPLLVDLLKAPLCIGAARRSVLDQLGRHYGRHFADQWEFARFAQDRRLGLDLLSPPPRQARPASRLRLVMGSSSLGTELL
jgi:hypothetical protein